MRNGEYIKLEPDQNNTIKSQVFPGLWLALDALFNYDLAEVLKIVQQGLKAPQHREFIRKINC